MRGFEKILPGTGRGTMRSMVEEARLFAAQTWTFSAAPPWAPSTAFGGPPPRSGEDLQ